MYLTGPLYLDIASCYAICRRMQPRKDAFKGSGAGQRAVNGIYSFSVFYKYFFQWIRKNKNLIFVIVCHSFIVASDPQVIGQFSYFLKETKVCIFGRCMRYFIACSPKTFWPKNNSVAWIIGCKCCYTFLSLSASHSVFPPSFSATISSTVGFVGTGLLVNSCSFVVQS